MSRNRSRLVKNFSSLSREYIAIYFILSFFFITYQFHFFSGPWYSKNLKERTDKLAKRESNWKPVTCSCAACVQNFTVDNLKSVEPLRWDSFQIESLLMRATNVKDARALLMNLKSRFGTLNKYTQVLGAERIAATVDIFKLLRKAAYALTIPC
jgi:hypothetical protein